MGERSRLSLGQYPSVLNGQRALVVGGERARGVAAGVTQELSEVQDARVHVVERGVGIERARGQLVLDPLPGSR